MKRPDEFYSKERWRIKRQNILHRDNYMDQYVLKKTGKMRQADTVHHILPREDFPQYSFEDWNLISVSHHTHSYILHNHTNGQLTNEGRALMLETAYTNGIKLHEVILVIGLPGSGKTTLVRDSMGPDAIAYDLDAIAGAFRLRGPHEEIHEGSRRMANALFKAFAMKATTYASRVFLIRTAPDMKELSGLRIDKLIICRGQYGSGRPLLGRQSVDDLIKRIEDAKSYCQKNQITVVEIAPPGNEN